MAFISCTMIAYGVYIIKKLSTFADLAYALMRWLWPDALAVVRPTEVYLLDFFCSCIQFCVLLSPYLFALSPFHILI